MKPTVLRIIGIAFWITVVMTTYASLGRTRTRPVSRELMRYLAGPNVQLAAEDPTGHLRRNDPVFFQQADGRWRQVAYVQSVHHADSAELILSWYDRDIDPYQCDFKQYRNQGRLNDVVKTLFPPERRDRVQAHIRNAMEAHGKELAAAFAPLIQESLRRSLPVVEDEFRLAVGRHRDEIDRLGERLRREVVSQRLLPLARREILPIVRHHGQPVAEQIGRELWDRASLWRFGWRAVYDRSPLPQRDLVQEEWDRFVDEEAVPVIESHIDEVVQTIQEIVSDIAANDRVRSEFADVAIDLANDPEAQQLVRTILRESMIENERLRAVWREVWQSDQGRAAMHVANARLEPVVRAIGDEIFGTESDGINPDFARVLRNQILRKDRRWIVAKPTSQGVREQPVIAPANDFMPYPMIYVAQPELNQDRG